MGQIYNTEYSGKRSLLVMPTMDPEAVPSGASDLEPQLWIQLRFESLSTRGDPCTFCL